MNLFYHMAYEEVHDSQKKNFKKMLHNIGIVLFKPVHYQIHIVS